MLTSKEVRELRAKRGFRFDDDEQARDPDGRFAGGSGGGGAAEKPAAAVPTDGKPVRVKSDGEEILNKARGSFLSREQQKAQTAHVEKEIEKLNPAQVKAVEAFTNGSDAYIRAIQMGKTDEEIHAYQKSALGEKYSPEITDKKISDAKAYIPHLEAATAKMASCKDTAPIVHRGMLVDKATAAKLMSNAKFTMEAHTSTTTNGRIAESFSQTVMESKGGDPSDHVVVMMEMQHDSGRGIETASAMEQEREVLMPKGTQFDVKEQHFSPSTYDPPNSKPAVIRLVMHERRAA